MKPIRQLLPAVWHHLNWLAVRLSGWGGQTLAMMPFRSDSGESARLAAAMSRHPLKASAHPISGVLNCPADTLRSWRLPGLRCRLSVE